MSYWYFVEEIPPPIKPLDLWGNGDHMRIDIELTQDECDALCYMSGMAMGAAHNQGNTFLFNAFTRLTNRLMANHPEYVPYRVPDEK
jgi:hypothetical protein